ncbi:DUF6585 family protein [Micromonospora sp. NPDC049523]|uniref:DUF6585 family protein n=1 Tax=Micromonospora sp. NPDC049523 TaxID=3155921 RepID=UPI003416A1B5
MRNQPSEITRIVADTGLGEVVARHRLSMATELSFAITYAVFAVFGLVFGDDLGKAMGAGVGVLAVVFAVPAWRKSRRLLYLCSGGLLTATGTTVTQLLTWDDVAHLRVWNTRIYQLGPYEEFSRCVLTLTDGSTLNLSRPPYADIEQLAAAVEQRMTAVSHPRRTAEIAATGATAFGPITVTDSGIHDGERFASWSDITRVERGRVRLRVFTRPGRPVISRQVRTVPDVAVLVAIATERAGRPG